ISKVSDELAQDLGRSPTVADLATRLGVSEEEIIEGLDCGQAYRALSLDAPAGGDGGNQIAAGLGDLIGAEDPDMQNVENREALRPLLAKLPEREQKIIAMRFHGNLTQTQIAAELGISQMHVSRLLAAALRTLRIELSSMAEQAR
ncbi:sigma-70 family RNA polymerase sigma factor, partial [Dactylosporangium sp. NPDC000555]|uniref:sigma-70 family RNA polymerase sigma factor n=1 Tax=Dactylosporangium sp. NPDC000555 TaxID=3154260 RepID=UPI00332882A1